MLSTKVRKVKGLSLEVNVAAHCSNGIALGGGAGRFGVLSAKNYKVNSLTTVNDILKPFSQRDWRSRWAPASVAWACRPSNVPR